MPIVKILPDGKVRIVNNKSGEVKDVVPEDLSQYAPRLVGDYQTLITSGEVAGAGGVPETKDPVKLALQAQQVQAGTFEPNVDTTEAERKQTSSRAELLDSITQAKKYFEENKSKNLTGFALGGKTRGIREQFGWLSKEQIRANSLLSQVNQMLAFSSSEGGGKQFTETEKELLSGIIMDPKANENVILNQLDEMTKGIKRKQEGRGKATKSKAPVTQQPDVVNSYLDKYFPKK